jgi:hypothetical protein
MTLEASIALSISAILLSLWSLWLLNVRCRYWERRRDQALAEIARIDGSDRGTD